MSALTIADELLLQEVAMSSIRSIFWLVLSFTAIVFSVAAAGIVVVFVANDPVVILAAVMISAVASLSFVGLLVELALSYLLLKECV